MKNFKILSIAGAMFALTGCFAEDYSFCPPEGPEEPEYNVVLNFRLPDEAGECSFLDHVVTTTTAIYDDATGNFVQQIARTDDHHREFKGLRLKLEPGVYRVVSWANHGENTRMNRHETAHLVPGDSHLTYHSIMPNGRTGDGDALYYAPAGDPVTRASSHGAGEYYTMEVHPETGHEGTLDFRHAHRRIEVYVKGFDSNGSTTPVIELGGLPSAIGFIGMEKHAGQGLVTAQLASQMGTVVSGDREERVAVSPFHVFYLHTADHDIDVNIIDPNTNEEIYTTKLNKPIGPIDPATDDPAKQRVLRILVEFKSVGVEVSVPDWRLQDIDYGWWD